MKEGSTMEEQLREYLMEGEQLLWTGRPESFETLDKTNKTSIIVGLVIKAIITLGILLLFIISAQENGGVKPGVMSGPTPWSSLTSTKSTARRSISLTAS